MLKELCNADRYNLSKAVRQEMILVKGSYILEWIIRLRMSVHVEEKCRKPYGRQYGNAQGARGFCFCFFSSPEKPR